MPYRLDGEALIVRVAACVLGVALALPTLVVLAIGVMVELSPSGWLMAIAVILVVAGLVSAPWRRTRWRGLARAGVAALALIVVGRLVAAGRGDATMVTLPGGDSSRWLGRIVDEQDGSLVGMRALLATRFANLPGDERAQLLPALREAFVAMRRSDGTTPSPVLDTLAFRQRPTAFDALVIEPRGHGHGRAETAVVFLHGYAGNFSLQCWLVAEAAREIDAVTVCPSVGFDGAWWNRDGERTVRATLDHLRARGIRRVYLAGLSNGGVGASLLAPRLARSLDGLILISGVSSSAPPTSLPTLVVQGDRDTMAPARTARAYATASHATYAHFDAGHFLLVTRRTEAREALVSWLRHRR